MKLTDELYLAVDGIISSTLEHNVNYLVRTLSDRIGKLFGDWAVDKADPACYIYSQGYGDDCRPNEAVMARGSDLARMLRHFAGCVADGALSRGDFGDNVACEILDLEISNEEYNGGLHIVVAEQDADNDDGVLYQWRLDQVPQGDWKDAQRKEPRK